MLQHTKEKNETILNSKPWNDSKLCSKWTEWATSKGKTRLFILISLFLILFLFILFSLKLEILYFMSLLKIIGTQLWTVEWIKGRIATFPSVQGELLQLQWRSFGSVSKWKSCFGKTRPCAAPPWPCWGPRMRRLTLSLLMRDSAVGHTPLRLSQMINCATFCDSLTSRDV